jgi:hypothetical protein
MNSYYSNLIEDHSTHPLDIERALRKDFSKEPAKRVLQMESAAHVATQAAIEDRLATEPSPGHLHAGLSLLDPPALFKTKGALRLLITP